MCFKVDLTGLHLAALRPAGAQSRLSLNFYNFDFC